MKDYVLDILNWYSKNKRDLPWRFDKNPYHVWISEIMLQQTRIDAVIGYYERFISQLPDIPSLANVSDDKLLKLWEGLGYYNRAKNLKKAAIMIVLEYQGIFPCTYDCIIRLPGIGEYTASAISSICFNEKRVTIDGNVMRVFTRFYNDSSNISFSSTKKKIHDHILSFIPLKSGDFNEGLMEIGERLCIPNGVPKCELCPLKKGCLAYKNSNYYLFPVKLEKKEKKIVVMTVILLVWKQKLFIQKRMQGGLLQHLFEFLNVEGKKSKEEVFHLVEEYGKISSVQESIVYTHVFTHKKWEMYSYIVYLDDVIHSDCFFSVSDIENHFALPTAFQVFLSNFKKEVLQDTL